MWKSGSCTTGLAYNYHSTAGWAKNLTQVLKEILGSGTIESAGPKWINQRTKETEKQRV